MAKNIKMNYMNSSGSYEVLYPQTDYSQVLNTPTIPSVPSLPLSVSNGGTGTTSLSNLANNLSSYISSGLNETEVTNIVKKHTIHRTSLGNSFALTTSYVSIFDYSGLGGAGLLSLWFLGGITSYFQIKNEKGQELEFEGGKLYLFVFSDYGWISVSDNTFWFSTLYAKSAKSSNLILSSWRITTTW